jgi:hypothetical protein
MGLDGSSVVPVTPSEMWPIRYRAGVAAAPDASSTAPTSVLGRAGDYLW